MSELGLTFEEAPSAGRHRHRRSSKRNQQPKRKGRAGKTFLAFLLVVLLLGSIAYGGWWALDKAPGLFAAEDYSGAGTDTTVVVEILPDQTLAEIGLVLVDQDVVASQRAFVEAANADPQAQNIQPGFYELPQQMRAEVAVDMLLDLENRLIEQVTIPEGLSSFRTLELLSDELAIPLVDLEAAAEDPIALGVPDFWYNRNDELEVEPTIEGFLFPSTYDFPPDPSAEQVLGTMVEQFLAVAEDLDFVDRVQDERKILPYEALIVASLAQAEAGVAEDLGRIARVAYNRVYQETTELGCNRCLQFDVTVNYWFELNGEPTKSSSEMTEAELTNPDNPYNRNREGLVPTPINNPGQAAMEGAMDPPEGDWLYFVAVDEEGNSAFAETNAEHCQNVQEAIAAGILDNVPC